MIKKLEWDTEFFEKKIGVLVFDEISENDLAKDLKEARDDNYKYIVCKLKSPSNSIINLLEKYKFYLSDIGINWKIKVDKYLFINKKQGSSYHAEPREAVLNDIPGLQEMIRSMFPNSRFYSDPFFSHKEADDLHEIWIENSVLGKAADIVFHIPKKGFVTCKNQEHGVGEIILIGVKDGYRGNKLGKALMDSSVNWFSNNGIKTIEIKTQLKNAGAINFYSQLGFSIDGYDMTFSYTV